MIQPGQVVLFPFPHTDQKGSKLRPALVVAKTPGPHEDWLICMISSQLRHEVRGFDEAIKERDKDFAASGLKSESLVRVSRLAVVDAHLLAGAIGKVSDERLKRIRGRIAEWIGRSS